MKEIYTILITSSGMGMLGAMGMMGANPAFNQQALMQALVGAGIRQGLDMTNPIIVQMMMQQMQQVRRKFYISNIIVN